MEETLPEQVQRAAAVLREAGATEVYVFGSAGSGTRRADSDIDLAVAGLPPERFFRAMAAAADAVSCELDLVDLDQDTAFTRYLKQKGVLQRVA